MDVFKFLGMGIVAILLCVNFTACSKDDEPPTSTTQTEPGPAEDPNATDSGDKGNEIVTVSLETAGDLESLLGDNMWTITSLKVFGPLNGDDIYCLRQMFGAESSKGHLESLDLKDASIVEGGRYYYRYNSISTDYYTSKDKIGVYMFYKSSSLKMVALPDNVTSIESNAFFEASVENVTIGQEVESIGEKAFYRCTSLESINIPDNVTSIESYAFYRCTSLESINIPDNVTSIGSGAFGYCFGLTNVTLGQGLTSIPLAAFDQCTSLKSINIPDNVTSIESRAFEQCTSLESINIPDNVTSIGSGAFGYCFGLTNVTLGQGLTSIPLNAFKQCTSLKSIIIPENITTIGENAFSGCTYLNELYCYATTPPSINSSFDKPNIFIYVPKGCLEVYQESAWGKYFSNIYEMD